MAGREPVSFGVRCERARHWASLRLDGELSTLEGQLLDRHLRACEECRAFDAGIGVATSLLREAPPELPRRQASPAPARRSRFQFEARRTALVAAAALALGALIGSVLHRPTPSLAPARAPEVSFLSRDVKQLRALPRVKRAATPTPVPSGPPNPPEGVI
jgi:ferric-dicitrate binding protein FerR (iron transport regulator)